ncbi:MAG: sulfotransferase [Crocosphaera sp.]|nr:sulfotransferase [Crocosphaera sp.]
MVNLRHSIRLIKNDIIRRYYTFRITKNKNPYQVALKKEPYKVLFILSHMRSGSSLLTHILISNSAIKGYGETHINYRSEADLKKLLFHIYFNSQQFTNLQDLAKLSMNHTYILDKLLHDHKLVNEKLLELDNFYFIFLIREPKRTLMSMLDHKPHWNEENAIHYYSKRLSTLSEYAQIINSKQRSFLVTYNQLMDDSDQVFKSLQNFLKTSEVFSEKYQVLKTTGMRNVGDFKEKIRSGRIIKQPRKLDFSISPHILETGKNKFDHCQAILSKLCQTVDNH